jgi:hypothetical protein
MDYYPRHAYVDWTGVDGYNCGTKNGGWQSFERVFQKIYPLLATEKSRSWLEKCRPPCWWRQGEVDWRDHSNITQDFPLIKCVVWFDIDKEADWRISSSPESERSFIRMMNDPYFNPWENSPGGVRRISSETFGWPTVYQARAISLIDYKAEKKFVDRAPHKGGFFLRRRGHSPDCQSGFCKLAEISPN